MILPPYASITSFTVQIAIVFSSLVAAHAAADSIVKGKGKKTFGKSERKRAGKNNQLTGHERTQNRERERLGELASGL